MTSTGAQAVHRAAHLLTLVVEAPGPIAFTDLHEHSGLARSTTSRLLAALESNRLIERDPDGAYRSGALFALYAARHDTSTELARVAQPVMRALGDETGETVNLAVARGGTVVQIAQVDATYLLAGRDWTAVTVPAHTSALGKALYAFGGLDLPSGRLEKLTRRSLGSLAALRREIGTITAAGYATTREELEIGLDAVAAPVRGPRDDVVAALGVSGPTARLRAKLDQLGPLLVTHADDLSHLLHRPTRTKGVA